MKHFKILSILTCLSFSMAWSQESKSQQAEYISHNRTVEQVTENGRSIVRLSEGTGAGVAWLKDLLLSEGTIEFDAKGRDVMQKSFIGIAFHGIDNETYETIYFRPFNFQSSDSARRSTRYNTHLNQSSDFNSSVIRIRTNTNQASIPQR